MKSDDLYKRYCGFYEKDFHEQIEISKQRIGQYFEKWKETDLAKMFCRGEPKAFKEVPVSTYADYPMLPEFGQRISDVTEKTPRKQGELCRDYYDRIGRDLGSTLDRYMAEPYYLCMKTTGTTGRNKWVVHGRTFWENLVAGAISTAAIACSDSWGETSIEPGDKGLNINAPVPHLSGWAAWASQTQVQLVPPISVTDNLRGMNEIFSLVLKLMEKGEKLSLAGGVGSLFYMMCKHFMDPQEFYGEYYNIMDPGLKKVLLYLKLLQLRLFKKG